MNICDVRTRWINVDKDVEKAKQMQELLDGLGFTDHQRFSAVTGIEPHEGVRKGEEHYRNCAESHFKILEETVLSDGKPVLILEDDVDVDDVIKHNMVIPVPDDADAIYLGTSHGDGNYKAMDLGNGWLKIERVFATHAIMHITKRFTESVIEVGKKWIYEINRPFDVGIAYDIQHKFNVYAPAKPFFYQSDAKNGANKWEQITRTPLRTQKEFNLYTIRQGN
jgi:hypothetical protein